MTIKLTGMMKVKKLIGVILVIALSMVLIGCGNDDSLVGHPLVGRWRYDETFRHNYEWEGKYFHPEGSIIQYNDDGTGRLYRPDGSLDFEFTWDLITDELAETSEFLLYWMDYGDAYLMTNLSTGDTVIRSFEIEGNIRTGMGLGRNRRFIMDTWFTTTRVR